jgi:conjugative relaxase-like TrwC/TraI family protein
MKIQAAAAQGIHGGYGGYLQQSAKSYQSDFHEYAQGAGTGPRPFWVGGGVDQLGLDKSVRSEQVERLAQGFHPITGEPLVPGAGPKHVMGQDLTFSAPKDVSAVFAGADPKTQAQIVSCLQRSVRVAMGYVEAGCVTRHGHAGRIKRWAGAALAACYTHFASRSLDPQLHVHAFLFNLGKKKGSNAWGALELRSQLDRKMATGILFRVELAHRLHKLGFGVTASGKFFTIDGIKQHQREALSTRAAQIRAAASELETEPAAADKAACALETRQEKKEPPLPELLRHFRRLAQGLGITKASVAAMQSKAVVHDELVLDHPRLLEELIEGSSCATAEEALCLICEKGMGRWNAKRCLEELDRFLLHPDLKMLGQTEMLTKVFTSRAQWDLEATISRRVTTHADVTDHRIPARLIEARFKALEQRLVLHLGVKVDLSEQLQAARHIACETGSHAFVEGWAGTGKTTLLQAVASAYKEAGFEVLGCCQSAAASQNLARETGISAKTIASLMLSIRNGKTRLGRRTIMFLDEAGMVGSREFEALQAAVIEAGAKLVCVGDPKQLQPIEAGGIFKSLMTRHGRTEISRIQRQRTDTEPLIKWLHEQAVKPRPKISVAEVRALEHASAEQRIVLADELCSKDAKLQTAFKRWRSRFDHEWMRDAVKAFATGDARTALNLIDAHQGLHFHASSGKALHRVVEGWAKDKTVVSSKTMIAATRSEVHALNRAARAVLVERGAVLDEHGIDLLITDREEVRHRRRFAPGDRLVFTQNDRRLGVANGVTGSIEAFEHRLGMAVMRVQLDEPNPAGQISVEIPLSFGRFDHAYCLTNHKGQGRTFDSAHVLINPSMADREWAYVASSRTRFRTTLHVDQSALVPSDGHGDAIDKEPQNKGQLIQRLAARLSRSRAKGTTLDYELALA